MVIENFYDNPDEVRASALQSDLIDYFEDGESYWLTSKHKYLTEPVYTSQTLCLHR